MLLPTTVIGSYPQPDWLVDREKLRGSLPPACARGAVAVAEPYLAQAQDDATALAILDQERAGVDIVTDGEIRRESYSNRSRPRSRAGHRQPRDGPGGPAARTPCRAWSGG